MSNQPQQQQTNGAFQMPVIFTPKALVNAREKMGFTQARLAHAFGTSQNNVSKWEAGAVRPSLANMLMIEDFIRQADDFEAAHQEATKTTELVPVQQELPEDDGPAWWPDGEPQSHILDREDGPAYRIKGWQLGYGEGASPNGSKCTARLFVTVKGTTMVEIRYLGSGRCYVTSGSKGYVVGRLQALPWAQHLVRSQGIEAFEDFDG